MGNKLKPCPYCGKTRNLIVASADRPSFGDILNGYAVECDAMPDGARDGCGARGPWAYTKRGAISAYNRRIQEAE